MNAQQREAIESLPYDVVGNGAIRLNAEGYRRIREKLRDPAFKSVMKKIMRLSQK